jgi:hypothetical protein
MNRLREGQAASRAAIGQQRTTTTTTTSSYHPFHVMGNENNKTIKKPSEKLACCVTYLKDFDLRCKKFNKTDSKKLFYTCNCLDFLKDTTATKVKVEAEEAENDNDGDDDEDDGSSMSNTDTDTTEESMNVKRKFQRECIASAMCSFEDTKLNDRKGQIINWIRYTDQINDRKKFIIPFDDIDEHKNNNNVEDNNNNNNNENDDNKHRQAISFLNKHRVCRSAIAALLDLHIMYPLRLEQYPYNPPSNNKSKKRKSNNSNNNNNNGSHINTTGGGDKKKKHQRRTGGDNICIPCI